MTINISKLNSGRPSMHYQRQGSFLSNLPAAQTQAALVAALPWGWPESSRFVGEDADLQPEQPHRHWAGPGTSLSGTVLRSQWRGWKFV